jgi:Galactose oxidase, central domain
MMSIVPQLPVPPISVESVDTPKPPIYPNSPDKGPSYRQKARRALSRLGSSSIRGGKSTDILLYPPATNLTPSPSSGIFPVSTQRKRTLSNTGREYTQASTPPKTPTGQQDWRTSSQLGVGSNKAASPSQTIDSTASVTSRGNYSMTSASPSQNTSQSYRPYPSNSASASQSSFPRSERRSGEEGENMGSSNEAAQDMNGLDVAGPSPATQGLTSGPAVATPTSSTSPLTGLVCNVHRTTGQEPHALVGATTTILGDTLFVFGGRILSRAKPLLTSDLYALDLISRHWTKVDANGDIPPPRYFHSVCALGDTKLVCYGGMSPATSLPSTGQDASQDQQPEVVVMSDIHIYDVPSKTWTYLATNDTPQGRYAHCATILPSSSYFASANAPLSAIHRNPTTDGNPNQGTLGSVIEGSGGAEMVIVGGQDSANHYIEQISVFNLRSLTWSGTTRLGKSCGAYRSVVAPLTGVPSSKIGMGENWGKARRDQSGRNSGDAQDEASSMLIYSNYNFLDVKLELQVRLPNGNLAEKAMVGNFSPPGLRFPNGGVIDKHFVVSGTYLTSSKQEYALWALDLRTLTWSRIDAGGSVFSQGSWNRGVLWSRRNMFVILGNRKRSLVEDYNHRRINFSNICIVELEAFGLYDNPRRVRPLSGYISASAPSIPQSLTDKSMAWTAGGRYHPSAAEELGKMFMSYRELSDMEFLAVGGEKIPVNSHLISQRWGPYFIELLRGAASSDDASTLRPSADRAASAMSHSTQATITPLSNGSSNRTVLGQNNTTESSGESNYQPPSPNSLPPLRRPRTLYLPHTHLTIQALVQFLYTSSLPPAHTPLCIPQILCSLLQIARPYQIDGLLEATVERLHEVLDGRNAAAVFNAAAMAAGGGRGVGFVGGWGPPSQSAAERNIAIQKLDKVDGLSADAKNLRINTSVNNGTAQSPNSAGSASSQDNVSESGSDAGYSPGGTPDNNWTMPERDIWTGEVSSVVGLQKRGLKGLMEGRRLRERGRSAGQQQVNLSSVPPTARDPGDPTVGLGIV